MMPDDRKKTKKYRKAGGPVRDPGLSQSMMFLPQ